MKHALTVTRQENFAAWYQEVISAADMAEESGVRGCMVIRPWGYGIWERIQRLLDARIKAAGVDNCYFPLFIPLSYFAREADHVDGFAKEMAVVTHHRLIADGKGGLIPDPDAKLEEPLIVRPTSETVIGEAMSRWVQSWRDLPLLTNQWANVVRWEMRTRMFLRTTEFLWQEGHTAHADRDDAMVETLRALEMYRAAAEDDCALPVIVGEKPEHERFPGAVATFSIEAMMQDGKALQAATSHYLGTGFAQAANIRYQDREGGQQLCHTTSWGMTTRMIGAMIMVHGDDDGMRVPPAVAPHQIIIVPMLRDDDGDAAVLDYCDGLAAGLRRVHALGEPLRVLLDKRAGKASNKRWAWIKKGAPVVIEVGPRDVSDSKVAVLRRDKLYQDNGKLATAFVPRDAFMADAADVITDIQTALFEQARARLHANIRRDITDFDDLTEHFSSAEANGWAEVIWSRPTGAALDALVERLKSLKLTMRNAPLHAAPADGPCVFTGERGVDRVLIGRAY
ncbi:MAG: proline--tRNA ligase [Sphingopyxis sp.]|nr:proline--tRNA ligase [Sphingopyxis sp.]